jgi:transcriptional regulator with XRE-family HTH domain
MGSPHSLLRRARQRAGLTQSQLATRAQTSQSTLARYESGALVPRIETLARLMAATEHSLVMSAQPNVRRGALTIDQVATDLRSLIHADGHRAIWRRLLDFVDDFRGSSRSGKVWLVEEAPSLVGDPRADAAIAGVVEELCTSSGIPVPAWVDASARFLSPWWFVNELPGYEATALRDTPYSIARHGVFVNEGALARA